MRVQSAPFTFATSAYRSGSELNLRPGGGIHAR